MTDQHIQDLAGEVKPEDELADEAMAQQMIEGIANELEKPVDDDMDGWVNEMVALSPSERADLEESIGPVKLILVKVSQVTHLFARLMYLDSFVT